MKAILCGVLGLAACSMFVHKPPDPYIHLDPPAAIAGPIEVEVSFGLESLTNVCDLRIAEVRTQGPNLVASGTTIPGYEAAKIMLKPGRYRFEATLCTNHEKAGRAVDVQGKMVVNFGYRERIMAQTADGLPHTWISFHSPQCVANPGSCRHFEPAGGGEPQGGGEAEPAGEEPAPSGPTCLPDGAYAAGDYGRCCHSQFHSDGKGHYICGN